ncbi:BamA/TamA family outer membrane protein, partial [Bacteroidales bacterium OttesenSCG-928-M11]|nr:BamA/TamA family outer membrane protein [Bacteroidales bacterium OttesenSCG-928-M11]
MLNKIKYIITNRKGIAIITLFFFLTSCGSLTRFVPEGQYLLETVNLVVDGEGPTSTDLLPYVQQTPAGAMEVKIYNSVDSTGGFFRKMIRKMGEPGVIFKNNLVSITEMELDVQLKNLGYLNSKVSSKVDTLNKKATVTYTITPNEPYHVRNYTIQLPIPRRTGAAGERGFSVRRSYGGYQNSTTPINRDSIALLINNNPGLADSTQRVLGLFNRPRRNPRLIREGSVFDMNVLEQERQRVNRMLLNMGYYKSNLNNIHYWADTTLRTNQVDLKLGLLDSTFMVPYTIERVNVYTGTSVFDRRNFQVDDSTRYRKLNIYWDDMNFLRKKIISSKILIRPEERYRASNTENTYNQLRALNSVGRVDIQYIEGNYADSTLLDCNIYIAPGDIHSIQTGLEGTNKDGDFGVALDVTYGHLNVFNGSETFNLNLRAAYEFVNSSGSELDNNYYELGIKPSLVFPRLHLPWIEPWMKKHFTMETQYSLGYNIQRRSSFARNFFNFNWKFRWTGLNQKVTHTLSILDVNYVDMPWMSDNFKDYLENKVDSLTKYSYENIFTAGINYGFVYSNNNTGKLRQHLYTLRFNTETSGNLLNWINKSTNGNKNDAGQYTIFGNPFAQYIKGDIDVSQSFRLDEKSTLAFRIGLGLAYPYGNSSILPFEKRYYGGGPNHVRGWSTRYLGPGSYSKYDISNPVVHVGDINLITSFEYRFKVAKWLEPAFFIDAGNIWTIKDYENQPGGEFAWDRFYKELAVGSGIGLRLDLSFLIVRLDFATRLMDPGRDEGDRWILFKRKFFHNSDWYLA